MMSAKTAQPAFDLAGWSQHHLDRVEQALGHWVGKDAPARLGEAMRYAVLDGGKRLRPLLVLAAYEAVQNGAGDMDREVASRAGLGEAALRAGMDEAALRAGMDEAALRAACAVELIHAYSLVHDDMPCMDNDVLRRGKPTVHVQFGEAQALLAGDALQAFAFELLTPEDERILPAVQATLCRQLARAAGSAGMAGGQAIDLASVGLALTQDQLRNMHRLKTGALLQASVMMGVACGASSAARKRRWPTTARRWGWRFRWWTISWMWSPTRLRWERPPARMLPATSPPMSRCSGWPPRRPMRRSCWRRRMTRWRPRAWRTRAHWRRWPTWW
jgi:farnesyl diphosphate synthase